jgi:hypothetical protein
MQRTTKEILNFLLEELKKATGNNDIAIVYAYGQPILESANGSRELSPRLSKTELALYMRAMIRGANMAKGNY